jgi:hypothetical protein
MGQIFRSTPSAYYEWHQVFKVGATYVRASRSGWSMERVGDRASPSAPIRYTVGRNWIWTPCYKPSGRDSTMIEPYTMSQRLRFT